MPIAKVDGLSLAYEVVGDSGQPWVITPGGRFTKESPGVRQLAVVLVLLSVPAAVLLAVALAAPRLLLQVVFHHAYVTAASALAPLGGAMVLLSVTVVLTMYLLAVGRRWVAGVLVAGGVALTVATVLVHGAPRATAVADLVVQATVLAVTVAGFTVVHRVRLRHGAPGLS